MYTTPVSFGHRPAAAVSSVPGERWYYRYPEEAPVGRSVDPSVVRRPVYEPSSYVERKGYDMRSGAHTARTQVLNFDKPNWGRKYEPEPQKARLPPKYAAEEDTYQDMGRDDIVVRENQRGDFDPSGRSPVKRSSSFDHSPRVDPNQHLRSQVAALANERDELQARIEELEGEDSGSDSEELQAQLHSARGEIARLKDQLKRAHASDSGRDTEELRAKLKDSQGELKATRAELTELRIQADDWKAEKAKLERDCREELGESEREIQQLQDERDQLLAQRDQLEDALHQAQADFDELSNQFNMLTVKSAELEGRPSPPMPAFKPSASPIRSPVPRQPAFSPPRPPEPHVSPAKTDLKTGPVRGRGECRPPERAHDLPWGVGRRSVSPSAPAHGHEAHVELCRALGVGIKVLDNPYDVEDGILDVKHVAIGSLAEKAGIRAGDRIEKWNNRVISSPEMFYEAVSKTRPGTSLRLGLMRAGIRKMALISIP